MINVFGQDSLIRVMTFNIRYDNPADGINSWSSRKPLIEETIGHESLDFICLQEVLNNQLKDLEKMLPGYGHIGVGRDDGKAGGEAVPVFYLAAGFKLMDNGTFWLSQNTDDTGSIGWDAALPRICTWGKFLDKSSGMEFYILNTHLDHMGDTARTESARLILDFINKETNDLPVILTGDFNSSAKDDPYLILTNPDNGLSDACLSVNKPEGCVEGTFNGFGRQKDPERIDMVYFKGGWKVVSYKVLNIKDGEMFISDHWPVLAEFKVQSSKIKIK